MSSKNDWLNFLEHRMVINNYLAHYGVEGMHWGIRRYQPYSTVPRKSGKGGKEIGAAKGGKEIGTVKRASKRIDVSKKYPNKDVQKLYNKWDKKIAEKYSGKDKKTIRKKLQDAIDNNKYDIEFEFNLLDRDYDEWPENMILLNEGSPRLNEPLLKEYEKYLNNSNKVIKYETPLKYKTDERGHLRANTSYGNCKDCLIIVCRTDSWNPGGSKKDVDKIISDKNFEKTMRNSAADTLYNYRTDNIKNETKEEYRRKLRCEQITSAEPDSVSVWYHHPDDFGDCLLTIDTKKKKIISSEGYS